MAKRNIYLIRHGQYELGKRDMGELTEVGQTQANITGQSLRYIPFASITSSSVIRAVQTAQIIGEMFPHVPRFEDDHLRECIPPVPDSYADYFQRLYPDHAPDRMDKCAETLNRAYADYFVPPEDTEDVYDMIVCHGNVIRYLVSQVLEPSARFWLHFQINNCGITRISIDTDGQMYVVSHNEVGHLPPDLLTEN